MPALRIVEGAEEEPLRRRVRLQVPANRMKALLFAPFFPGGGRGVLLVDVTAAGALGTQTIVDPTALGSKARISALARSWAIAFFAATDTSPRGRRDSMAAIAAARASAILSTRSGRLARSRPISQGAIRGR